MRYVVESLPWGAQSKAFAIAVACLGKWGVYMDGVCFRL